MNIICVKKVDTVELRLSDPLGRHKVSSDTREVRIHEWHCSVKGIMGDNRRSVTNLLTYMLNPSKTDGLWQ